MIEGSKAVLGRDIAIIIPTLNPDESLLEVISGIRQQCGNPIIVVNDGSRADCDAIFEQLSQFSNLELLTHAVNQGKGRALKSAFNYYLNRYPNGGGGVTVDGDGQHGVDDIIKCIKILQDNPQDFVLGVRDFSEPQVPFKSRFGNNHTKYVFRFLLNIKISDTQTGLRGISSEFMKPLLNVLGERFEYETEMLIIAKRNNIKFHEVKIETIYLDDNRATHFNPIKDSFKIYRVILQSLLFQMFAFFVSSLASFMVDLAFFYIFLTILPLKESLLRGTAYTLARVISSIVNYLLNRNLVFNQGKGVWDCWTFIKYAMLCVVVLASSFGLTECGVRLFPEGNLLLIKTISDTICFILSFSIQKIGIFR